MKPTTGSGRTVEDILSKEIASQAIRVGEDHECVALKQFANESAVVVKECGLFVDKENPFLGATPDGFIEMLVRRVDKKGIRIEAISRDEDFWKKEMLPWLKTFYMHCMLPELVDRRRSRGLPIREPDSITEAQKNCVLKQASKKKPRNGASQ
ncbi:hypothetical protein MTO96_044329 [Rhipicephalus appendiculatus]